VAGSLEDRQTKALAARPDYLQARLSRQQAANGMRMARAEFLPKVSLFSSWEADNQTFAARGGDNWAAGATLSLNLSTRREIARVKESKHASFRREPLKTR